MLMSESGLKGLIGLSHYVQRGNRDFDDYDDGMITQIIFPIFDTGNQVIGFGGRVMDDSLPKYLNSPETSLFNKSRSLYGLHKARGPIRENREVFIVEGYFTRDCTFC